jgi:superfamily I DNA/RNA helicase
MNPKMQSLLNLCKVALKRSNEQTLKGIIDFDDMVYQPLFYRAKFWPKTFVLVDEAQDLNPARRLLAMRMAGNTGRIIAVGDPNQAIYGFTGADSDSMDLIKDALSAQELPLTMTYRCPKAVVREAQRWVPDFQAHESNPEGLVRTIPFQAPTQWTDDGEKKTCPDFEDEVLTNEDAILCRNTKPLVELAWYLIKRGIACRVEGREIGAGLVAMARRWKVKTLDAFKHRVESWKDREITKYRAKGKEDMIQSVEDKADTILCIVGSLMAEGKTSVADFEAFVTNLFGDTKEGERAKILTLCTGHRSKGREWKRVYWLFPELCPSKYAKKPWQLQQEENLQYVIVTRSMHELVYVSGS